MGTVPAPAGPLANLVRALRERALLTQEELAQRAGLSVGTVRGLESGRIRRPRSESVRLLADALALTGQDRATLIDAVRQERADPGPDRPTSAAPVPAQLPPDVAAFTGRREALARLDGLLAAAHRADAIVIAAIEGPPGVGKTALAVHWAHRNRRCFPDGQLYADLQGFAHGPPVPPIEVLARFLAALGVPRDQVPTDPDEAVAAYRSRLADRRVLVVLDNAANPSQVRPLVPGGSGSLVMATSRHRLTGLVARDGAHRIRLQALPDEESSALLERLLGAGRVRAERVAVKELAALCGHLPLALRVAAANLSDRPQHRVADYVSALRGAGRLGALAVSGDAASAVPAAFDLSYARLPAPARRMFRRLGLVPGPEVDIEAAAAVAGVAPPVAAELLDGLVRAHLVEERSTGRYACHELLRHYARDRAQAEESSAERKAVLDRLQTYYLAVADAAVQKLHPVLVRLPVSSDIAARQFASAADAQDWLDVERANLIATIKDAARRGPASVGWRLADVLRGYLALSPYLDDWRVAAQAGLAAATADGGPLALAAAQLNLAHLHLRDGDYHAAIEHATEALAACDSAGWAEGEGALLNLLGNAHWSLGELGAARDYHGRAYGRFERLGWKSALTALRGNLARVSLELGRLTDAAEYAHQSLADPSASEVAIAEAMALEILGEVHYAWGRLTEASGWFTQARAVSVAASFHSGEADAVHGLALIARDRGDHDQAAELAEAALALARRHSLHRVEVDCVLLLTGLRGSPVDGYREALALARRTGERHPEVEALIRLARALRMRGQYTQAHSNAVAGLESARRIGYRLLAGAALTELAEVFLARGCLPQARAHGEAALRVGLEVGHCLGQAHAHLALGRTAQADGRADAAEAHRRTARTFFAEMGMPAP